jgi:amidohydrolase
MSKAQQSSESVEQLKQIAGQHVDDLLPKLTTLAEAIHGFIETKFEEHQSAEITAGTLQNIGFAVERKVAELETAFVALAGTSKPRIAFLAEYDALPGIGHGCGHNLIAAVAVGAGAAIRHLQTEGMLPGSVAVIGTPGEEGGGGKVFMVEHGVFDDIDAVLMAHPGSVNIRDIGSLARIYFDVEFFGQSSHAAGNPEKGINALDAMIQTFVGINALRQHVPDDVRMHGIITHGGDAVNVIPEYTSGRLGVRASRMPKAERVFANVKKCVEAAALATGCDFKITEDVPYREMKPNKILNDLAVENLKSLGRDIFPGPKRGGLGSTDLGDVSHITPAISLTVALAGPDIIWHSKEVHKASIGEDAWKMIADAAKAIAFTAVDALAIPGKLDEVKSEFNNPVT